MCFATSLSKYNSIQDLGPKCSAWESLGFDLLDLTKNQILREKNACAPPLEGSTKLWSKKYLAKNLFRKFTNLQRSISFIWLCLPLYASKWQFMNMYDSLWIPVTTCDSIWLFMTQYNPLWLCKFLNYTIMTLSINPYDPAFYYTNLWVSVWLYMTL